MSLLKKLNKDIVLAVVEQGIGGVSRNLANQI